MRILKTVHFQHLLVSALGNCCRKSAQQAFLDHAPGGGSAHLSTREGKCDKDLYEEVGLQGNLRTGAMRQLEHGRKSVRPGQAASALTREKAELAM